MLLKQTKYFITIVDYHSFTEAAEQCFISQSAISQQIKSLEKELGICTIFFNSCITPKWMTYLLNKDETVARDFAHFGLNVMGIQDQGDNMANAKAGIEALQNFIKDELHLPTTLSEMNITDEKFDELKVKACYGQDSLPRAYRPLSQEDCLNIYKMCL